jgi:Xaa-Pro aminopeptidase
MTFDASKNARPQRLRRGGSSKPIEFHAEGLESEDRKSPNVIPGSASCRQRRERLSERFPGELLVIPTGHRKVRANDTYFVFRPGTDFYYRTSAFEPDCVLVLVPKRKTHEQAAHPPAIPIA